MMMFGLDDLAATWNAVSSSAFCRRGSVSRSSSMNWPIDTQKTRTKVLRLGREHRPPVFLPCPSTFVETYQCSIVKVLLSHKWVGHRLQPLKLKFVQYFNRGTGVLPAPYPYILWLSPPLENYRIRLHNTAHKEIWYGTRWREVLTVRYQIHQYCQVPIERLVCIASSSSTWGTTWWCRTYNPRIEYTTLQKQANRGQTDLKIRYSKFYFL